MNNEEFRKEVEKQLIDFSKEKIIYFSWLCAVKVLPILGIDGSFIFWETDDKHRHLCSIFHALDVTADMLRLFDTEFYACINANTRYTHYSIDNSLRKVGREVLYATDAATIFATTAVQEVHSPYTPHNRTTVSNAARAAFAARTVASSTASAAFAATNAALQTDHASAIRSAASAAAYAAATADAAKAYGISFWDGVDFPNFYIIILNDLQAIRMDKPLSSYGMPGLLGEIWRNFQNALEYEECSYWGDLYQKIFDNGFIVDLEATRNRVSIPDDVKKKGASAVARYLERLENSDC